jgi:hypothetical protein
MASNVRSTGNARGKSGVDELENVHSAGQVAQPVLAQV